MFGADTAKSPSTPTQITKKVSAVTSSPRPLRTAPVSVTSGPTQIQAPKPIARVVLPPSPMTTTAASVVKTLKPTLVPIPEVSVPPMQPKLQAQPTSIESTQPKAQVDLQYQPTFTPEAAIALQPSLTPADTLPEYTTPSDTHDEFTPITDADIPFHEIVRTPNQYNDALPPVIESITSPVTDQPLRPAPQDMEFMPVPQAMAPKGLQPGTVLPSVFAPEVLQPSQILQPMPALPERSVEDDNMPSGAGTKTVPGSDYGPSVPDVQTQLYSQAPQSFETELAPAPSFETALAPVSSGIQASFAPVLPTTTTTDSMIASSATMVPLIATMSWPSPGQPEPVPSDDYAQTQPQPQSIPYSDGHSVPQIPAGPAIEQDTQQAGTQTQQPKKTSWLPLAILAGVGAAAYYVLKD